MTKKKVMDFLFALVVAYFLTCIFMFLMQRKLMYFPEVVSDMRPQKYGLVMEVVETTTKDGLVLNHWFSKPKDNMPVVVYFHGNAGYIGGRNERARMLQDLGFGVFLAEYRGFGSNPGAPAENGLIMDAYSVMDKIKELGDYDVVLYGESLGTGVSVQTAAKYDVKAVVLEAPYSSTSDVAKDKYMFLPVDLLMKDTFKSTDYIKNINAPVLIMHGADDITIPPKFGERLYNAAIEPKKFHLFDGQNHVLYFKDGSLDVMLDFLKKSNVY
tara:strand:- start:670 stop:1479 length:810 start_codon:yes stop_codon:yes gene_type:complete